MRSSVPAAPGCGIADGLDRPNAGTVGERPPKGKVKTSPLRANKRVATIARAAAVCVLRRIPGVWFLDGGTGVSPLCRLNDSDVRDARATIRVPPVGAVFARSRRLNLHAHTR